MLYAFYHNANLFFKCYVITTFCVKTQSTLTRIDTFHMPTYRNGWVLNNFKSRVNSWCRQLIRWLWWHSGVRRREETWGGWHLYLNVLRLLKMELPPTEITSVPVKCFQFSLCLLLLPREICALEGGKWGPSLWVDRMASLKLLTQRYNKSLSRAEESSSIKREEIKDRWWEIALNFYWLYLEMTFVRNKRLECWVVPSGFLKAIVSGSVDQLSWWESRKKKAQSRLPPDTSWIRISGGGWSLGICIIDRPLGDSYWLSEN